MKRLLILLVASIFCLVAAPVFSQDIEECKKECANDILSICDSLYGDRDGEVWEKAYNECVEDHRKDVEYCYRYCDIEAAKEKCKDWCMGKYLSEEARCADCFGRKTVDYYSCMSPHKKCLDTCFNSCDIKACKVRCMLWYIQGEGDVSEEEYDDCVLECNDIE